MQENQHRPLQNAPKQEWRLSAERRLSTGLVCVRRPVRDALLWRSVQGCWGCRGSGWYCGGCGGRAVLLLQPKWETDCFLSREPFKARIVQTQRRAGAEQYPKLTNFRFCVRWVQSGAGYSSSMTGWRERSWAQSYGEGRGWSSEREGVRCSQVFTSSASSSVLSLSAFHPSEDGGKKRKKEWEHLPHQNEAPSILH